MSNTIGPFGDVASLLHSSILTLAYNITLYQSSIQYLPPNVKSRLLYILTKRGLVTDENISPCLHPQLKELDLSECTLTDVGLEEISQICKNLFKIDLNSAKVCRTTISTKGVAELARGCKWLQVVYLRRCLHVTDDAIFEMSQNCRNLKHLNLGGCPNITDDSLNALAENCYMLESLNVSSTKVTDEGVFSLCQGKCRDTLKELHIAQCPGVSDSAVEASIEFCPQIQILLFHGCPKITDASRVALEQLFTRNSVKVKQITWTIY